MSRLGYRLASKLSPWRRGFQHGWKMGNAYTKQHDAHLADLHADDAAAFKRERDTFAAEIEQLRHGLHLIRMRPFPLDPDARLAWAGETFGIAKNALEGVEAERQWPTVGPDSLREVASHVQDPEVAQFLRDAADRFGDSDEPPLPRRF